MTNILPRTLSLLACLASTPAAFAQATRFDGHWLPDDPHPAGATCTGLSIEAGRITWHAAASAPACVQRFVLRPEKPGTQYANGRGTRFIAGVAGSLPTYLLGLAPSDCGSRADAARISFPLVYDNKHIELIEYVAGKPVAARRFHRK
jgi:hypothetical protein